MLLRQMFPVLAWRTVRDTGVWAYQQNDVTGARRAQRVNSGGHQPLCQAWLDGGSFPDPAPAPPAGGSGPRARHPRLASGVHAPVPARPPRWRA